MPLFWLSPERVHDTLSDIYTYNDTYSDIYAYLSVSRLCL